MRLGMACLVLVACGGGNGDIDASADVGVADDSGRDAGTDAVVDASEDAGADTAPDVATDSGPPCEPDSVETAIRDIELLYLVDRSASMDMDGRWASVTSALTADVQAPESEGVRAALNFFPADSGRDECAAGTYDPSFVSFRQLPAEADAIVAAIAATSPEGVSTPVSGAIEGSLQILRDEVTEAGKALVFITDGEPTACDTVLANITATVGAALDDGVRTYAIAVPGASVPFVEAVATAGGTSFLNGEPGRLPGALGEIRADVPTCSYALVGDAVTRTDVNITALDGEGAAQELRRVADAGACEADAWYEGGAGVVLCPEACTGVAEVQIELGCAPR